MQKNGVEYPELDMAYVASKGGRLEPNEAVTCLGVAILGRAFQDLKNPSYRDNAKRFYESEGLDHVIEDYNIKIPARVFREKVKNYLETI